MTADPVPAEEAGGEVTILLDRKKTTVPLRPGETLAGDAPAAQA